MNDDVDRVRVKKCGVRFKPAALVIYYEELGRNTKLRERVMPLRNFTSMSSVKENVEYLKGRHRRYLSEVSSVQLERLVRMIQLNMEGFDVEESLARINDGEEEETEEERIAIDPNEDLNKLDDECLQRKKDLMNETYEVNRKRPGDDDFEYDVRRDFESIGHVIESSGWDSDKNDSTF